MMMEYRMHVAFLLCNDDIGMTAVFIIQYLPQTTAVLPATARVSDWIERTLAGVERHLRHRSSECEMQNLHVIPECILNCLLFELMSLGVSLPLECLKPLVDASELSSLNPNRNANPKAPRRRLKQMPKWELPRFNELTLVHYTNEDISHSQQNINIWMKAFPLIHSWT